MKKVSTTGRTVFQTDFSDSIELKYTKVSEENRVIIDGEINVKNEKTGAISYDSTRNMLTISIRKMDALSAEDRVGIGSVIMSDVNIILGGDGTE